MLEWNLGQWYFTVRCQFCDTEIAFLHDPSAGCLPFSLPGNEMSFTVVCPDCGGEGSYNACQVTTVRATK